MNQNRSPCQHAEITIPWVLWSCEVVAMDILIIEDDPVIGKAVHQGLKEAGNECQWVKDGENGLEAAQSQKHQFSILELLMRHAGQVVTRKMLCESLWESDWEGTTNVIEVHINRLRTKLQRGSKEPLIHTIRGRGYALRAAP